MSEDTKIDPHSVQAMANKLPSSNPDLEEGEEETTKKAINGAKPDPKDYVPELEREDEDDKEVDIIDVVK